MKRRVDRHKLRKQPKRYRAQSKSRVQLPDISVPKEAKKRKRRHKTKNLRKGIAAVKRVILSPRWLSLALLVLTVYALVVIAQDKRFYLNYIPVDGTIGVTPEEVVTVSGLAGNHIFSAEPALAAERIAELPGIISSTVTLRWPNQVYIRVAEEMPVAIWAEEGTEFGITSSGRLIAAELPEAGLFKIVSEMHEEFDTPPPPEDTAVIDGEVSDESFDIEAQLPEEPEVQESDGMAEFEETDVLTPTVTSVLTPTITAGEILTPSLAFIPDDILAGAIQLREFRPTINQLYYRPFGGLSFEDDRGWRGYFGTGTDMNQKLVIYESIVEDLLNRGIFPTYVSVSNQEKPYYGTR